MIEREVWDELITPTILGSVYRHARETYPQECCGMMHATGNIRRCQNAQDELHAADPVAFPRTSRNGYCFNTHDQLFLATSFEGVDPVRVVYHSHPDAAAYFSSADCEGAMCGDCAAYPELLHLVIACRRDRIGGAALFGFQGAVIQELARFAGTAED